VFGEVESSKVALPEWSKNNPVFYTENAMRFLNLSQEINGWIDLIFGFKQTGESAVAFKNVFLPSAYHTCTPEELQMEEVAFASQVLNFGQCPIQLFVAPHANKLLRAPVRLADFLNTLEFTKSVNKVKDLGKVYVRLCEDFVVQVDVQKEILKLMDMASETEVFRMFSMDFAFVSHLSVSSDGLWMAVSFDFGRIDVFQLIYEKFAPIEFQRFGTFSAPSSCHFSVISSQDFICASAFGSKLILWNFATQLRHREVSLDFRPSWMHFDWFNGMLTVFGRRQVQQFTVNGIQVHSISFSMEICSAGFVPFECGFDKRAFVVAHPDGTMRLIAVDAEAYRLAVVCEKKFGFVGNEIIVDMMENKLTVVDKSRTEWCSEFRIIDQSSACYRCHFCPKAQTGKCAKCQLAVCDACRNWVTDLCPTCTQAQISFSFRDFRD
jgi:hypothetical protein